MIGSEGEQSISMGWEPVPINDLRLDGRWESADTALSRRLAGGLYAVDRNGTDGELKRRVAILTHVNTAIGPWVRKGLTRLETSADVLELHSGHFFDFPWNFAPKMRDWRLFCGGREMGYLRREPERILAIATEGDPIGYWETPFPPAGWPGRLVSYTKPPEPLYTSLAIFEARLELRLPYYDGRSYRLDFSGRPFLLGALPEGAEGRLWALAFLAVAAHASLNLQSRAMRRMGSAGSSNILQA